MTNEGDLGISVEAGADGVKASISSGSLSKLGQLGAWLFPAHAAKVKISAALAERVTQKIRTGQPLDEAESYFVSRAFEKEALALRRAEAVVIEVQEVLPLVRAQMQELPPPRVSQNPDAAPVTPGAFSERAQLVASELSEDSIRSLFSRVLAGEYCKPGTYSIRTLETLRTIDPAVAESFQQLCNLAFDRADIIRSCGSEYDTFKYFLRDRGFTIELMLELIDHGLIADGSALSAHKDAPLLLQYGSSTLRITGDDASVGTYRFTRVGREIASVLKFVPDPEYFRSIATEIRRNISNRRNKSITVEAQLEPDGKWYLAPSTHEQ